MLGSAGECWGVLGKANAKFGNIYGMPLGSSMKEWWGQGWGQGRGRGGAGVAAGAGVSSKGRDF